MRLLFYCGGSYVYGAEILILAVMRELAARGHDVRCMASHNLFCVRLLFGLLSQS